MTASTPMPSVASLTQAATSTCDGSTTSPTSRLVGQGGARRVHLGDEDVGRRAAEAYSAASAPIGPAPVTSTVSPGRTPRGVDAVRRHGGRLDERALQVGDLVGQDAHVAGRARRRARRCRPSRS